MYLVSSNYCQIEHKMHVIYFLISICYLFHLKSLTLMMGQYFTLCGLVKVGVCLVLKVISRRINKAKSKQFTVCTVQINPIRIQSKFNFR